MTTTTDNTQQNTPDEVKSSWFWINDTKGLGSVTVTFATIGFLVTTLAYLLSIVKSIYGIEFRQFDVAACAAYVSPVYALYLGRKWTEAKLGWGPTPPSEPSQDQSAQ